MAKLIYEEQPHQKECVENIIAVLEDTQGCADFSSIKARLEQLQQEKDLPERRVIAAPKLDVLMETGTGKTFTYIQTMYEMQQKYGVNRFIIFVPRKAIREGVIQSIKSTHDYFSQQYGGEHITLYSYDGDGKLDDVKSFIRDDEFSVLILTSHSITSERKENRLLTRRIEDMLSEENIASHNLLDAISSAKPVIFIDEPHLLASKKFLAAYNSYFKDCLCLRFGASFPARDKKDPNNSWTEFSNAVFVLDSLSSLRRHLVKKIFVNAVSGDDELLKFSRGAGNRVIVTYVRDTIVESRPIAAQDDIGAITGLPSYAGVRVAKISSAKVSLTNRTSHKLSGKLDYKLSDASIRVMIRKTIELHFAKERELFAQNIKTLSLFFIPSVSDFRSDDARIKKIFDEEYLEQRREVIAGATGKYKKYLQRDFDESKPLDRLSPIRGGYFSRDNSDDEVAKEINLILRQKEELLSLNNPLRFIFSVWALQEGWDNPNIFNICKLSPSEKDTSRRQQAGRGLRISVNGDGARQTIERCDNKEDIFYDNNSLDMIVSGSEGDFIREIQQEINRASYTLAGDRFTSEDLKALGLNSEQVYELLSVLKTDAVVKFIVTEDAYLIIGPVHESLIAHKGGILKFLGDVLYTRVRKFFGDDSLPVVTARQATPQVALRKKQLEDFKELWDTITRNAKIKYNNIDEDKLSALIGKNFDAENISPVKVRVTKKEYNHADNSINLIAASEDGDINFFKRSKSLQKFIIDFAKHQSLPLKFVLDIFNQVDKNKIKNNPNKANKVLSHVVQESIHSGIINQVSYDFGSEVNISPAKDPLYTNKGKPRKYIKTSAVGRYTVAEKPADSYVYDRIIFDSNIEKEASLQSNVPANINGLNIKVFAKLPAINIPTPYKNYNPDFAYLVESADGKKKIYFVVETKGYYHESEIPADEKKKIDYAHKFFAALEDLQRSGSGNKVKIEFKSRITTHSLIELLQDVIKNEA